MMISIVIIPDPSQQFLLVLILVRRTIEATTRGGRTRRRSVG